MNSILKASLTAAAVALSASASATVYYVSDCAAGAAAGCVAGSDSNNGTSVDTPWKTTTKVASMIGKLAAGDEVRFARGASFANARMYVFNLQSRAAKPLIFDSYKPKWGTGTQKPILTAPTGTGVFNFEDSGNADHDEGYVIRNLDLRGQGAGTAIFIYNDADYITLDSLEISNFSIGIECSNSNAPNPGSDGKNDYITVRNSNIHDNKSQGYLGGCNHVLVENNRFDNNGFGGPLMNRNHNVYISGNSVDIVVRGNTLTRSAVSGGVCQGVPLVVHDTQVGLVIENNVIDESTGAGNGCYGIQVNPGYPGIAESFRGTVIRGNKVINAGGVGIALGSCPDCVVENNFMIHDAPGSFVGVGMPAENIEVGVDAADDNLTVRNNSIYIASGVYGSYGVRLETYGKNHKVVSNLVYYGSATSGAMCFSNRGLALASFAAFDSNLCFNAGTGSYSQAYSSLAQAQAAGFDRNGKNVDPMLVAIPSAANGYSMKGKTGSPLLNAGIPTLTLSSGGVNNIGAYDKVAPGAPTSISIK